MKKQIGLTLLLFITITSNASFPVPKKTDKPEIEQTKKLSEDKTEAIQANKNPLKKEESSGYGFLSLALSLLWLPFAFLAIAFTWGGDEETGLLFTVASITSIVFSFITGFKSIIKKEKHRWAAYLGIAISLLTVLAALSGF